MKREQLQRDLGLASRTIRGATNKNAVLKAIAPDAEGVDQVLETQEEMVPAMVAGSTQGLLFFVCSFCLFTSVAWIFIV